MVDSAANYPAIDAAVDKERAIHRNPFPTPPHDLRYSRLLALIVLIAAIGLGAHLRFERLGAAELSRDEGSSWAAASAPTIAQVLARERVIDPGKLAIYDVALHCWIGAFGDSAAAMRSMSAILGVISIILLFFCTHDAWLTLSGGPRAGAELAGAFAALLMATNLAVAGQDRTARMYPLMIAAALGQMLFFLRLHRAGRAIDYAGMAFLTALILAINFTAGFFLFAEGLWLIVLLASSRVRRAGLSTLRPALGIAAGIALLLPIAPSELARSNSAVSNGALDWVRPQTLTWPVDVLARVASGLDPAGWGTTRHSPVLLLISVVCIAIALWRSFGPATLIIGYLVVWAAGPLICAALVSWLIHPVEIPRYVLMGFIGLFALIGAGLASIRSTIVQIAIVLLVIHYSSKLDNQYLRNSGGMRWRDVTHIALQRAVPDGKIVVFPPMSVNVVRYDLEPPQRAMATSATEACEPNSVLILAQSPWAPVSRMQLMYECYPRIVAQLPYLQVRMQGNHFH